MQFLLRLEVAKCQNFPRPYRGELFPPSKPSVPLPPSHPQDKFQFLKKLVISKNLLKKLGFWDTPPPPLPSRGLRNPQVEWIFQNIILVSPMVPAWCWDHHWRLWNFCHFAFSLVQFFGGCIQMLFVRSLSSKVFSQEGIVSVTECSYYKMLRFRRETRYRARRLVLSGDIDRRHKVMIESQ